MRAYVRACICAIPLLSEKVKTNVWIVIDSLLDPLPLCRSLFVRVLVRYDSSGSVAAFLIEQGADDSVVNNVGLSCYDGVTLADTLQEPGAGYMAADNFW